MKRELVFIGLLITLLIPVLANSDGIANYIIEKANELKDIRVREALIRIANNLK